MPVAAVKDYRGIGFNGCGRNNTRMYRDTPFSKEGRLSSTII